MTRHQSEHLFVVLVWVALLLACVAAWSSVLAVAL